MYSSNNDVGSVHTQAHRGTAESYYTVVIIKNDFGIS